MHTLTFKPQQNASISVLSSCIANGWTLFLKAPWTIFAFMLATMVFAGMFQILPAPIGMLTSKWVAAMLAAAMWPIIDQIARTGKFSFKGLASYRGWKALPVIALLLMLPFISQVIVASAMMGNAGISLLLFGELANVSAMQVATIFALGAPLSVFMMFIPARLLINGNSLSNAVTSGIKIALNAWQAMIILTAINATILFLAPYTFLLSALLLSPLLVCINYQAYIYLSAYQKEDA